MSVKKPIVMWCLCQCPSFIKTTHNLLGGCGPYSLLFYKRAHAGLSSTVCRKAGSRAVSPGSVTCTVQRQELEMLFFFIYVTGKYLLSKIEIMNIVFNIPDYLTLEDHIIYHVLELVLAKVCMTLPRGIAPWLVAVPGMAALWGFVWVLCFVL